MSEWILRGFVRHGHRTSTEYRRRARANGLLPPLSKGGRGGRVTCDLIDKPSLAVHYFADPKRAGGVALFVTRITIAIDARRPEPVVTKDSPLARRETGRSPLLPLARRHRRPGIIILEDLLARPPLQRLAAGAPLTKTHPVPVPAPGDLEHLSLVFDRKPRTVQPPPPQKLPQVAPRNSRRLFAGPNVEFGKRSGGRARPHQRRRLERPGTLSLLLEPRFEFFLHVA